MSDALPDFQELFAAEERHFWFRTRNDMLAAAVGKLVQGFAPGYRVLEVGCGTGNVLRMLERTCAPGAVTGMDLHAEALAFARQRVSCPLVCGDVRRWPFPEPFELIGLFDVLEHLEDDRAILDTIYARLRPGGALALTVPASQRLWSDVDVYAGHFRRYSRRPLMELLAGAGFAVEFATPFMGALWPAMWLKRALASKRRQPATDVAAHGRELALAHLKVSPAMNAAMAAAMAWERHAVRRGWRLPLGTSLLAVARKPTSAAAVARKSA